VNIALILYILVSKRLFGLRGGRAAHEAHLRSSSLLQVEQAAQEANLHRHETAS
jgi:hypothetical protein